MTADEMEAFRDHTLLIENASSEKLLELTLSIQGPEQMLPYRERSPAGATIEAEPDRPRMVASTSGGGKVKGSVSPFSDDYIMKVSQLLPDQSVEIDVLTRLGPLAEHGSLFPNRVGDEERWAYYIEGAFQFKRGSRYGRREFFVPILYDDDERRIRAKAVQPEHGQPRIIKMSWP